MLSRKVRRDDPESEHLGTASSGGGAHREDKDPADENACRSHQEDCGHGRELWTLREGLLPEEECQRLLLRPEKVLGSRILLSYKRGLFRCQPLIMDKKARKSLRRCTKAIDWKKEAGELCDCSVKAGIS